MRLFFFPPRMANDRIVDTDGVITVRGKQRAELSRAQLNALAAAYAGVTIDLGTGDGAFAYRYAQARGERFVIGIDPVRESMREYSAKAARKPERGGLPNLLYVVASIEQVPAELHEVADSVCVNFPWGSLMRGIILGEADVLGGLTALMRDGARLRMIVNTRIFDDPIPLDVRDLPEPTPEYVRGTLGPAYGRAGLRIDDARLFDADEVAGLGTTWAKRLSHRRPPPSVCIEATLDRRASRSDGEVSIKQEGTE